MTRRLRRRLFFAAIGLALAAIIFLFHPVRVIGPSMRPALREGDMLLAGPTWLFGVDREDLVLLEEPDTRALVVKRIAGLPGESVQIVGEDLFLDSERLQRPVSKLEQMIPLVDVRGKAAGRYFSLRGAGFAMDTGRWRLEGEGSARLLYPLKDGFLNQGKTQSGRRQVTDVGLEVEFELESEDAVLEVVVQDTNDVFKFVLDQGGTRASLVRAGELRVLLDQKEFSRPVLKGKVFLANVDRVLIASLNDRMLMRTPYALSQPRPGLPPEVQVTRLAVGGRGPLFIDRLIIARDFVRVAAGTQGTAEELHLGRDEFYVLGDDPHSSRDSRQYGAVPRERIRGRVLGRLWPPGSVGMGWRQSLE